MTVIDFDRRPAAPEGIIARGNVSCAACGSRSWKLVAVQNAAGIWGPLQAECANCEEVAAGVTVERGE